MDRFAGASVERVLDEMIGFVEEAGALALQFRAAGLEVAHKGAGLGQALTQADLTISRLLHDRFGPRVIEEETAERIGFADAEAMLAQDAWTFVADPIDGTKGYAGGLPGWGTMIAACRRGWPVIGVLSLPAWHDDRTAPARAQAASEERGILLAAHEGSVVWAPTRAGRRTGALQPLAPPKHRTNHVAWGAGAAQRYALDYERGFFPWCESASITEAALIATGRLDATVLNSSLWDAAPLLPILEACGYGLYHWPDLAPPTGALIELCDATFSGRHDLWLACRDREQATALATAIRPNPVWQSG